MQIKANWPTTAVAQLRPASSMNWPSLKAYSVKSSSSRASFWLKTTTGHRFSRCCRFAHSQCNKKSIFPLDKTLSKQASFWQPVWQDNSVRMTTAEYLHKTSPHTCHHMTVPDTAINEKMPYKSSVWNAIYNKMTWLKDSVGEVFFVITLSIWKILYKICILITKSRHNISHIGTNSKGVHLWYIAVKSMWCSVFSKKEIILEHTQAISLQT